MNSPQACAPSTNTQDALSVNVQKDARSVPLPLVGQRLNRLSDQEREDHIRDCAWLMEDAMRRYHETSDFGYRGESDRWRLLMEAAINSRSPEYVARLERERGLV